MITSFTILDTGVKGTLVNVYGPSTFPQKPTFFNFLTWMKDEAVDKSWIIGGKYNLITSLKGKKGGVISTRNSSRL